MSYTETEAAEKMGVSVEQLRMLVRNYIAPADSDGVMCDFRPSDLVVLRILAASRAAKSATA